MDKISILDFGCQYTQLIGRRVRELNVYSEILPSETPASNLNDSKGVILSGSPSSVYDPDAPMFDIRILELGIPVLGICYGAQLITHLSGGRVRPGNVKEYGRSNLVISRKGRLFKGMEDEEIVWMSHGDSILEVPEGYDILARSRDDVIAAIADMEKRLYGVQFHPEVSHTVKGMEIIKNFVVDICGCNQDWTMENYIGRAQRYIREMVGNGKALVLVSGGIDSTVAAVLVVQALGGDNVYALHIDNGLMRKDESADVAQTLRNAGIKKLRVAEYESEFLRGLRGVVDPEVKRSVIGDMFVDVMEAELFGLCPDADNFFLVQGTLYTDMIESGRGVGRKADKIKTHHNVSAPKIEAMRKNGMVVEPNREIYKDEVRVVGSLLGLPEDMVWRHPFPGPGLGIRITGNVSIPNDFDGICSRVREIAGDWGFSGYVFPIRTVGVQGSARTYRHLVLLSGKNDWKRIRTASEAIIKNIDGVNRCVFALCGAADQSSLNGIRPMEVNRRNLSLLREIDHIANDTIKRYGLMKEISQMPVILFPGVHKPWVSIRDVKTDDFMTARPMEKPEEFPWECAYDMLERINSLNAVEGLVFDATDKPPATVEYE